MKKLIALTMAVLMMVGMVACGSADSGGSNPGAAYNIGVCQLVQHVALDAATQGFVDALKAEVEKAGKTVDEIRDYAEEMKLKICHWVTVDDLNHLKRGGRVSAATALFGTMLTIKPIIHVDNEGHLINVAKARGRKISLMTLADEMEKRAINPAEQTIFISHGDCEEDVNLLADELRKRFGVKEVIINYVGPVIGAHTGAGVVALFFVGTER